MGYRYFRGVSGRDQYRDDRRLKTDFDFFNLLFRAGQRAGRKFLEQHFDDIGVRSSLDETAEVGVEWA